MNLTRGLVANGKPEFKTGIGINYGLVTVGNIGSEKKMDYTIIGDMVNLGQDWRGLQNFTSRRLFFRKVFIKRYAMLFPAG